MVLAAILVAGCKKNEDRLKLSNLIPRRVSQKSSQGNRLQLVAILALHMRTTRSAKTVYGNPYSVI